MYIYTSLNFFHDKDQVYGYFLNKVFQASKRNYWGGEEKQT